MSISISPIPALRLVSCGIVYIPEHALDPGDDFVGRGVGGLVLVGVSMRSDCKRMILKDLSFTKSNAYQVDDTGGDIGLDVALGRRRTGGDGGEMTGADEEIAVVLQEKRPLAGVDGGLGSLGLDNVFCRHLNCCFAIEYSDFCWW